MGNSPKYALFFCVSTAAAAESLDDASPSLSEDSLRQGRADRGGLRVGLRQRFKYLTSLVCGMLFFTHVC